MRGTRTIELYASVLCNRWCLGDEDMEITSVIDPNESAINKTKRTNDNAGNAIMNCWKLSRLPFLQWACAFTIVVLGDSRFNNGQQLVRNATEIHARKDTFTELRWITRSCKTAKLVMREGHRNVFVVGKKESTLLEQIICSLIIAWSAADR